jgi:hypothetical protein
MGNNQSSPAMKDITANPIQLASFWLLMKEHTLRVIRPKDSL